MRGKLKQIFIKISQIFNLYIYPFTTSKQIISMKNRKILKNSTSLLIIFHFLQK